MSLWMQAANTVDRYDIAPSARWSAEAIPEHPSIQCFAVMNKSPDSVRVTMLQAFWDSDVTNLYCRDINYCLV